MDTAEAGGNAVILCGRPRTRWVTADITEPLSVLRTGDNLELECRRRGRSAEPQVSSGDATAIAFL